MKDFGCAAAPENCENLVAFAQDHLRPAERTLRRDRFQGSGTEGAMHSAILAGAPHATNRAAPQGSVSELPRPRLLQEIGHILIAALERQPKRCVSGFVLRVD